MIELFIENMPAIVSFILGGGLISLLKTLDDASVNKRNAKLAGMKAPVEVESLQISGLETLVEKIQEDNNVLRTDRDYWKEQYRMVKDQVDKLSAELERQEAANRKLRDEIDDLRRQLNSAAQNSPAVQAGRLDLAEGAAPFPNN